MRVATSGNVAPPIRQEELICVKTDRTNEHHYQASANAAGGDMLWASSGPSL